MKALRRPSLAVGIPLAVLAFGLFAAQAASADVLHAVPTGGATSGSCGSWGTACTLQYALSTAGSGDEVWVEAGVYLPTTNVVMSPSAGERGMSFDVPPGVAVYGGFAGTETLLGERDPATNPTVLSGDIDGDDTNGDGNGIDETSADIQGDNSYHVVYLDGTGGTPITATTILDGFTITGGEADGDPPDDSGGGLYCNGAGSGSECSPTLSHLAFRGNRASLGGGALYNDATSSGTSSPTVTQVTFSGNSASLGGAVYNVENAGGDSSPSFTNDTFSGNQATVPGGGMLNDGASPTLTHVTFNDNKAYQGAAIFSTSGGHTTVTNSILWGDTATSDDSEVYNYEGATISIDHSVVDGGCGAIGGAACGAGNLGTDPVLGPLQDNGGSTETMALGTGSSALDTADDGACPATDQRGVTRPQGEHCDIGAYEAAIAEIPALGPVGLALLALLLAAGALGFLSDRRRQVSISRSPVRR